MLGAEDGAAVVVEEHVGGEGPLEVVALGVLEALLLPLEFLEFLGGLGPFFFGLGEGLAGLLLLGVLLLVFGAISGGRDEVYWGVHQFGHRMLLGEGCELPWATLLVRAILLGRVRRGFFRGSPRAQRRLVCARRSF